MVLTASGATRPRYGGALRVEVSESVDTPEPPRTGPLANPGGAFRLTTWQSGHRLVWSAVEDAPGGRAFVDSIEVELGRDPRQQALDLELGKTDLAQVDPGDTRRTRRSWGSEPVRLLAVVFARATSADLRAALALSIDRATIHSVLLRRQGEPAAALLPQWLSGYAYLFDTAPNLARSRSLVAGLPARTRAFTLGYDAADPLARRIAERIAVNARDAGLLVAAAPSTSAAVRLVEVRISSDDPAVALAALASSLGLPAPGEASTAQALYTAERALVDDYRVVPLAHLPDVYGVGPRVRTWLLPAMDRLGGWRLENVWLADRPPGRADQP